MRPSVHTRRKVRLKKRSQSKSKLNLVALMDIFTILVFFLLVNSSTVEVLQTSNDIKLPESVADQIPEDRVTLTVSQNDILINGRRIVSLADVSAEGGEEISALKQELDYLAARRPFASDADQAVGRDITIMGDAAIPYNLLKRIMTTCAQSQYRNISLAVRQIAAQDPNSTVAD